MKRFFWGVDNINIYCYSTETVRVSVKSVVSQKSDFRQHFLHTWSWKGVFSRCVRRGDNE